MKKEEVEAYLAKIRKTISESEALVEQAERRIAETDELLERFGVTREQLRKMKPTPEQLQLVNEELARRGLEQIEPLEVSYPELAKIGETDPAAEFRTGAEELENRKRKFSSMMQGIRL